MCSHGLGFIFSTKIYAFSDLKVASADMFSQHFSLDDLTIRKQQSITSKPKEGIISCEQGGGAGARTSAESQVFVEKWTPQ